jgi:hypothetical protein
VLTRLIFPLKPAVFSRQYKDGIKKKQVREPGKKSWNQRGGTFLLIPANLIQPDPDLFFILAQEYYPWIPLQRLR